MTDRKVLLIGLDAACFRQLDPLLASGSLPNIRRLIDSGVSADLETTSPPWTPSAWPSVTTGSAPWTHGIYDFHHYPKKNDPQLVGTHDVRVPFVWEVLSAHGLSSIVVNVPVTHPVHEFDGSLVPGCLAPEQAACLVDGDPQPMAAIDEAYRIYDRGYDPQAERLADYERLIDSRVDAARRLDDAHDWSFMMVQFQHTDAVFHTDGEDPKAVSRVYERVDGAIGSLRDLAGEDCPVLLVSDHGMHRYDRVFYCNTWLRDNGYLETATDAERHAWNERTFRAAVTETRADTDADGRGLSERILGAIVEASSRLGVTAQRAEQALSAVGLDERVGRLLPEEVLYDIVDAAEYVDRSQSAAYCRSPSSLGIRCNVVGRDSEGVVPAAEFESFRTALVESLRDLRGPTGEPVFESVSDRHATYGSEVANERSAPDIVLRPAGMAWKVSDIVRERTFGETEEFNHMYQGLFVASGPGIDSLATSDPSVVDVTPTVLRLLGIEPLETMDGRTLFDPPTDDEGDASDENGEDDVAPMIAPRRFFDAESEESDADAVEDHLRAMGYIE